MASLTFFTATGTYLAALKDSLYDVDSDPELTPMSGAVTFTPLIDSGDSLPVPTLSPPANLWLAPVRATIKSGVITTNGVAGVKLVANTAVLGLSGNLFYRVDFYDGLLAGGKTFHPDPFTFQAPTTATTVDLVEVTPLPGSPAVGNVLPVLSVGGKTGAIILTADDVSDFGATGKSLARSANQTAAWTALGSVPTDKLPNLALIQFKGAKADQAAMLATTGEQGDWVTRSDTSTAWIITGADPTQLSNWTQLPIPALPANVTALASLTSAANKGIQFTGAGTAGLFDLTAAGKALLDDTDAAAQRVTLGAAPLASPTFTGTVSGVSKTMVGLANVDNTSDANKPVNAAQQAAFAQINPIAPTGTNDQAVIDAAVAAAAAAGRSTVWLNPGTFNWDADISPWTVPVKLAAVQPGKTTIQLGSAVTFGPRSSGTKTQIGGNTELASAVAGARSVTTAVDRSALLSPGDVIMVTSDQVWTNRNYYTLGEWNIVSSVSGTTVNLKWPLRNTYDGTTYNFRIYKLGLLENTGISGIAIKGSPTAAARQIGAQFKSCKHPVVQDVRLEGTKLDSGIQFYECVNNIADRVECYDIMDLANTTGFTGYGIVNIGTLDAVITNLYGERCRHLYDEGADFRGPSSVRTKIVNARAYDCYGAGMSTHGGSEEAFFDKCSTVNCGGGFILRGRASRTRGCSISGVTYQSSNAYVTMGQGNQSSIHGVWLGEQVYTGGVACQAGQDADLEFDIIDVSGGDASQFSVPFAIDVDTPANGMRFRAKTIKGHKSAAMRLWAPTIRNSYFGDCRIITPTTNTAVLIDIDPTIATGSTTAGTRSIDGYNQKGLDIRSIHFDGYGQFAIRLVGNPTGSGVSENITIMDNKLTGKNTGNSSAMRIAGGAFSQTLGSIRVERNQALEHGACCTSSGPYQPPNASFSSGNALVSGIGA